MKTKTKTNFEPWKNYKVILPGLFIRTASRVRAPKLFWGEGADEKRSEPLHYGGSDT